MKYQYSIMTIMSCVLLLFSCKNESAQPETLKEEVELWSTEDTRSLTGFFAPRGQASKMEGATEGYILFSPGESTKTFLMNKDGQILHQWVGELNSMQSYLKENGNLVRLERDTDFPVFAAGGQAGRITEYTWDGEIVWNFKYATDKVLLHHDIELLPNGNILAISYDAKTMEEAIAAGRDPDHVNSAGIWSDKVIEIKPIYPEGGEIVWEWKMWDHLIQDHDPEKNNYGNTSENPRKFNINVLQPHGPPMTEEMVKQMIQMGGLTSNATPENQSSDITHMNGIDYNEKLDQIAISVPGYGEIIILDHSTTTEEAASSEGGQWGHGGDLLYRWGNPQNYGRGEQTDQRLFFQHDVRWIPEGFPGEGELMVFNNDVPGPPAKYPTTFAALGDMQGPDATFSIAEVSNYSAVYQWSPPQDGEGSYILNEGPFGPDETSWSYIPSDTFSFYSPFVSGAERMKNGNTIILEGARGRFFEVTPEGEKVWEYWQPYNDGYKLPDGTAPQPIGPFKFAQFRIQQFDTDYEAFAGKELKPLDPQPETFKLPPPPPQGQPGDSN